MLKTCKQMMGQGKPIFSIFIHAQIICIIKTKGIHESNMTAFQKRLLLNNPFLISVTTTTAPQPTASTSIAQIDYIYLLVLLILLIPLLICVFILIKRCHSRKKNVKNTRKSQECLVKAVAPAELTPVRADKNPPKMFKLHNYQPGDTKTLVPVFKPKIPARISPMFDPGWQPSKLPCLVPLAKVQPLYTDTTEDYLRSRLPRRPSHLSLYSFDSVIFSTEP